MYIYVTQAVIQVTGRFLLAVIIQQLLGTPQTTWSGIQVLQNKALPILSTVSYQAPACTLPQHFSNFNVHTCSQGSLLNADSKKN